MKTVGRRHSWRVLAIASTMLCSFGALGAPAKNTVREKVRTVKMKRVRITNAQALYQAPVKRFLVNTSFEYDSTLGTLAETNQANSDRIIEHGSIYKLGIEYGWTNHFATAFTIGGKNINITDDLVDYQKSGMMDSVLSFKARNFISSRATINYGTHIRFGIEDSTREVKMVGTIPVPVSATAQDGGASINPFLGIQFKTTSRDVFGLRVIQSVWGTGRTLKTEGLPDTTATPNGILEEKIRGGALTDVKAFWEHRLKIGSIGIAALYKYKALEETDSGSKEKKFKTYSDTIEMAGAEITPRWKISKNFEVLTSAMYMVTTSEKESLYQGIKVAGGSISNVSLGFRLKF